MATRISLEKPAKKMRLTKLQWLTLKQKQQQKNLETEWRTWTAYKLFIYFYSVFKNESTTITLSLISLVYVSIVHDFFEGTKHLLTFFSSFLRICSLRKKSLTENFIFCAVKVSLNSAVVSQLGKYSLKLHGVKNSRIRYFIKPLLHEKSSILKDFMKLLQILPKTIIQSN